MKHNVSLKNIIILLVVFIVIISIFVWKMRSDSAEEPTQTPKMNAVQVIEHVNQVMENEYVYQVPSLRYQISYKALSAKDGEYGYWHVTVEKKTEAQRLYESQWTPYPGSTPQRDIIYRFLEEATGELTPTAVP